MMVGLRGIRNIFDCWYVGEAMAEGLLGFGQNGEEDEEEGKDLK